MIKLEYVTLERYNALLKGGMLWVVYPEATGSASIDLHCVSWELLSDNGESKGYFYDIDESLDEVEIGDKLVALN